MRQSACSIGVLLNTISSSADTDRLRDILNTCYPIYVDQLHLHRDMIGYVYIAEGARVRSTKKYVLKLYRPFDTENTLRSIGILAYLKQQDYPVVSIIPTREGALHVVIDTPRGISIGILFDYLDGPKPDLKTEMLDLARQVGRLHRIMETYPQPLPRRGKDFYIDRYLGILQELDYPPNRIADLAVYGSECWSRLERLPVGFCHGDLHTGNMRQTAPGCYALFDFDIASRTHPLIDIATLCDASDFNRFDAAAYARTQQVFEHFYQGYRREREVSDTEITGIFDFISVRYYEIIATITQCQGLEELSRAFLDEQYDWLIRWKELCERKSQHSG
jgi:Ser/Thr protein kinase RdoA (MazF antagonist)